MSVEARRVKPSNARMGAAQTPSVRLPALALAASVEAALAAQTIRCCIIKESQQAFVGEAKNVC